MSQSMSQSMSQPMSLPGATASYTVTGMTCEHCATSVREEVGAIAGVRRVEVDVPSGRVTVTSDGTLPTDQVRAAVEEAGYQLTTD